MLKNSLFNPKDKRKSKYQCVKDFCIIAAKKQRENIVNYNKKPNQILIRNGKGELKLVSKSYYAYHTTDSDYDTETEIDEEN